MSRRILVTGADGQVGWELARTLKPLGEVFALNRAECDLSNPAALAAALDRVRPDIICNAAAYTAVDRAESEPELARRVNATAVGEIGQWAAVNAALVLHYSTDYVFDGRATRPYPEDALTSPKNVYGRTKLQGEELLAASGAAALTCRTSWVFSARGHNFVRTILRLAREREVLRVVADQRGSPTWARWLAEASAQLLGDAVASTAGASTHWRSLGRTLHLTGSGETSWHGFAEQILATDPARAEQRVQRTEAISTAEFPTPASRPAYTVLDCEKAEALGIHRPRWEAQLAIAMQRPE
jgi:dTDP-4-dehydrorhamnose reductase